MLRRGPRSFFRTIWRSLTSELLRWLVSAVLALATAGFFLPEFTLLNSFRAATALIAAVIRGEHVADDMTAEFTEPVVFFALLTISLRVIVAAGPRLILWFIGLQSTGEAALDASQHGPPTPQGTARDLRSRARQQRRSAQLLLGMISVLILLGFLMFQNVERNVMAMHSFMAQPLYMQQQSLTSEVDNLARAPNGPANVALLTQKRERLHRVESQVAELSPSRTLTQYLLVVLTTRIAAVVFLVFLVQFLGNIYRYQSRLSFFLDLRADVLGMVESTPAIESLIAVLLPEKSVDLDKMPGFPVLDQLKDVLNTLGGKK